MSLPVKRLRSAWWFAGWAFLVSLPLFATADEWPQWRGPQADGVWRETGVVEKFAGPEVPIVWRQPIGAGYTGPTVAQGRVYVMDRITKPAEVERVLCFDEATGKPLWKHEYPTSYGRIGYPAGPRACVTLHEGAAYALGAAGMLHCLEAASGKVLWRVDLNERYEIAMPIWGVSGSPVIVGEKVILHACGKKACIVALDRQTGGEVWTALAERGQYTTPLLVNQAGVQTLVCWTGDSVASLSAADGAVLWRYPWRPKNMPIGVATPVLAKDRLFFTSFYDGALMLKLDSAKPGFTEMWKRVGASETQTDALHSIISTPVFDGEHVYGVDSYGELRCLSAADGERVWENLSATPKSRWSTIHFVKHQERYFLFNERGELLIGKLSPQGFEELSRAKLLEPTTEQLRQRGGVCWSHPAFANRRVYARNDKELVCGELATKP